MQTREQGGNLTAGNFVGMLVVEQLHVLIERFNQFIILDNGGRRIQAGSADDGFNHNNPTSQL